MSSLMVFNSDILTDGLIDNPSPNPGDMMRDGKKRLLLSFCVAAERELLSLLDAPYTLKRLA